MTAQTVSFICDVPRDAAESLAKGVRLPQITALFLELKALSGDVEEVIDKQTCDEHRKADFDMPADAQLFVVITAELERKINRIAMLCEKAHEALKIAQE